MRWLSRLFLGLLVWLFVMGSIYLLYQHFFHNIDTMIPLFLLTFLSMLGTMVLHLLPIEKDISDEYKQD